VPSEQRNQAAAHDLVIVDDHHAMGQDASSALLTFACRHHVVNHVLGKLGP
jgi:hypothetical protein